MASVSLVVAWTRFAGLRRLKSEVEEFRNRGGHLRVILGIDEGGATQPGLTLVTTLADEAFVFHNPAARTFHPKLFLCEGPGKALLWVGSSNITAGGLFTNYEAALEAGFSLPDEEAAEALVGVRAYIDKLLGDEQLCRPLDPALLARLVGNPRYLISEDERRRRKLPGAAVSPAEELFGASRHDLVRGPGLPNEAREELENLEGAQGGESGEAEATVLKSWSKLLPRSDAQQPLSPNTNPTGNMRLTGGNEKVNWRTWFREDLLGEEVWSSRADSRGNQLEVAVVPFDISIEGEPFGREELTVDHAPHRESGQANHMTVLHWGPLMPVLLATDYSNYTVTIERMSDGTCRLDISP